ncbi:hypothetical protein RND81_07G128400 [Saponaria officinalis]|uniref:Uncharacterized protein n=1 Tax=Saponaria officinalis TaxID=3572 RepID=A0AAW1JSC2_SAPOF
MLRYANRSIFSLYEPSPWGVKSGVYNVSNYAKFAPTLAKAMNNVIKNASSTLPHFAYGQTNWTLFQQLYTFAQCTPDIDASKCDACLKKALSRMIRCCDSRIWVVVFMPNCQLRYDTTSPFINDPYRPSPPPPTVVSNHQSPDKKKTNLIIVGAIAVSVLVGSIVLAVVFWICFCRNKPSEANTAVTPASPRGLHNGSEKDDAQNFGDTQFVRYDLATLKTATTNFSTENTLGEGGFGTVYMGTLKNGEQLAIKRLSGTSGQGTKEFMTEAGLLAKLQHRNLVRLMGFCSEGEEKLLVYEFMLNASLDRFLFDPNKRPLLNWVIRDKILMGIARGLQYLHDDSRLTIVHRDLKPGNVLLDREMNPKVADFGLAKLFEDAQTFGNTSRIVGSLGYMAPAYLTTGEYSDKSDVYSFGIILLEIVSGQSNKRYYQLHHTEDLPVYAWRLWTEKRPLEITDPVVFNNCSTNDVTRCIQIGLLCLQANAAQRPTMALVVSMLTGTIDLPLPSEPAMSFPQFNMPVASSNSGSGSGNGSGSGDQQSEIDRCTINSVSHELHLQSR